KPEAAREAEKRWLGQEGGGGGGSKRELGASRRSQRPGERRSMTNSANGEWLRLSLYVSCTAVAVAFLSGKLLAQAVERPDWSIELVDPKVLRVCADPHNMPFSTDRG